jgi:hypothetical protein
MIKDQNHAHNVVIMMMAMIRMTMIISIMMIAAKTRIDSGRDDQHYIHALYVLSGDFHLGSRMPKVKPKPQDHLHKLKVAKTS